MGFDWPLRWCGCSPPPSSHPPRGVRASLPPEPVLVTTRVTKKNARLAGCLRAHFAESNNQTMKNEENVQCGPPAQK